MAALTLPDAFKADAIPSKYSSELLAPDTRWENTSVTEKKQGREKECMKLKVKMKDVFRTVEKQARRVTTEVQATDIVKMQERRTLLTPANGGTVLWWTTRPAVKE